MIDAIPSLSRPVLRLLHDGLTTGNDRSAEPLAPEKLCDSGIGFGPGFSPVFERGPSPEQGNVRFMEARPPCGLPGPLYLCGRCTSSLDVARSLAEGNLLPLWGSVLAVSQTHGRGQLRRRWSSPAGNIHAAIRLPQDGLFAGSAASCVMGGLLTEVLEHLGGRVAMKWPNDVISFTDAGGPGAFKVGGILLEERGPLLLAGIGLNTSYAPAEHELREDHALPAGRLSLPSAVPSVISGWADLVGRLFLTYGKLEKLGEAERLTFARRHLAFRGCRVEVTDGSEHPPQGKLLGIDDEGNLLLVDDLGKVTACCSGSLKLVEKHSTPTALL